MPQLDERLANLRTVRTGGADTRFALDAAFDGVLRRRQRRRLRRVGNAGAVVVAMGVALAATLVDRDGRQDRPITTETTATATAILEPVEVFGTWEEIPPAPLSARIGAAMVSAGDRLVVWGGRGTDGPLADGAVYDVATKTWSSLADSPLSPSSGPFAAKAGDEVWILSEGDAAAYDLGRNGWRLVRRSHPNGQVAVSTGSALVDIGIFRGPAADAVTDTLITQYATGEVRVAASSPSFGGQTRARRGVFAAGRAIVVSIADGKPVTVDPLDVDTLEWDPTITTEMDGLDLGPEAIAAVGTKLFLIGHYTDGAVVDLETGQVERLAMSASSARYPALTVDGVITVGDRWLDPESRAWYDAAPIPVHREFPSATTIADSAVWWGGDACGPGANCVTMVDPVVGLRWTPPDAADRATARERIFDELRMNLTLAAGEVASGADIAGTFEIVNDSGQPITDPDCRIGAIKFGVVPADGSRPSPLFAVNVDCGGAHLIDDGERESRRVTFFARTTQGDDLAQGEYFAVIEIDGRTHRLEARVTVT